MTDLLSRIIDGDFSALARAITIVENQSLGYRELLKAAYRYKKESCKIGITGPPGSGKSTLTSKIVKQYISMHKNVGVICVDPSSSFTGGAILGDRIRMQEVYSSKNVFIRSVATRGSLGGLSHSVANIEPLLEAFGFDVIIYETVGVGQIELDVANYADSVILVLTPESGDDIQMMKAGLIECASIIVVNKSDRPSANKMKVILEQITELSMSDWVIPVVDVIAIKNKNIDRLCQKLSDHHNFLKNNNLISQKNDEKYIESVKDIVREDSLKKILNATSMQIIEKELEKPIRERVSPYEMFERIKG